MKLRFLIVDDIDSMRKLVLYYLSRYKDILVVGEAKNGDEAIVQAEKNSPDVILMDISLPKTSGIEVTRRIKTVVPNARVYLFSAYEVSEFRDVVNNSPADGFIQKSSLKSELLEMIQKELDRVNTPGNS